MLRRELDSNQHTTEVMNSFPSCGSTIMLTSPWAPLINLSILIHDGASGTTYLKILIAEGVGFEPTRHPKDETVFKTAAVTQNLSANLSN